LSYSPTAPHRAHRVSPSVPRLAAAADAQIGLQCVTPAMVNVPHPSSPHLGHFVAKATSYVVPESQKVLGTKIRH
jgi:hypothetical protein